MIYFVRHGATDWNDFVNKKGESAPKCQGRADIPLNKRGEIQAKELAKTIKDVSFDKVLCSPLTRAKQTCEILMGTLDGVIIDDRLSERDFGEFEGLTRNDFDFAEFCRKNSKIKFKTAESVENVEKRVFLLLDELKQEPDKNVLIVAHGGVGCAFLTYFDGETDYGDYKSFIIPHGTPIIRNFK